MDVFTEYYIRKYNALLEQIKKYQNENRLLEDLTSGGIDSTLGSRLDDDDISTTNPGSGSGSGSGSGTNPPPTPTYYDDSILNLRGTSIKDIATLSRRRDQE